jgi:hypothetical protein
VAGAHQLKMTNSIEPDERVNCEISKTLDIEQLLGIHYFFATGLQEKPSLRSIDSNKTNLFS